MTWEVAGYVFGTAIARELLPLAASEGGVAVDATALQVMMWGRAVARPGC
jgi:hypothetical protein